MIFVLFQYIGLRSYDQQMPDLVAPTIRLQDAWREAHEEWGPGMHEDGFGLLSEDDVESSVGFAAWLKRLSEQSDPARRLDHGQVRCTYRWIVEDDQVLGGIALRHELTEAMMQRVATLATASGHRHVDKAWRAGLWGRC